MNSLETINVIVTIVIFLAVAAAAGQVIFFNLTAESTKNLDIHKAIAYIGMGAAGYALFGAHCSLFGRRLDRARGGGSEYRGYHFDDPEVSQTKRSKASCSG